MLLVELAIRLRQLELRLSDQQFAIVLQQQEPLLQPLESSHQ